MAQPLSAPAEAAAQPARQGRVRQNAYGAEFLFIGLGGTGGAAAQPGGAGSYTRESNKVRFFGGGGGGGGGIPSAANVAGLREAAFEHDFDNVEYDEPEFDGALNTPGLHKVGRQVRFEERRTLLPPDPFERCDKLSFLNDPAPSLANLIRPGA